MTLAVLVPVKDLSRAKTRLAQLLSESERAHLASLLLEGVLTAIAALPDRGAAPPLRRIVVTAHAPSASLASRLGFEVLPEEQPVSESASVDRASELLQRESVSGVLRVPLDLPLIDTRDVQHLIELAEQGADAGIVTSLSGTGTNGLFRAPPTAFPSRFGPGSLALHLEEARRRGFVPRIESLESLALDIDDPADIRVWRSRKRSSPALAYLESLGIAERLARLAHSPSAKRDRAGNGS
jgi:2-phospho-L-lactate/phosphoenolpyruvate guanylyltransferase